jgi:PBP1b-binding outer membrane lipoprotein LpoB
MKKTTNIIALILITVLWTGCKKSSSPDVRDVFVATYDVTETWTENGQVLTKPAFTMSIEKSSQHAEMLLLNNFANYGAGTTAEATVNGNAISIPQQTLSNSKVVEGTGTIADQTLTYKFSESFNGISNSITAVAKKK